MSCHFEDVHIDDVLQVLREEGACCVVCDKGGNRLCEEAAMRTEIMLAAAEMLERLMRERDAAVADVKSLCATNYFSGDYCAYCKYREPDGQCFHDCTPHSSKWGWEWRGVRED